MLKVVYSEVVKSQPTDRYGLVVERTKQVGSLTEAVNFSRYIANTSNVVGLPTVIED